MRWYYIVVGLLLLPLLLLLLRVGVEYRMTTSELTLRIGPLRKKLSTDGEKKPKKDKKPETAAKTAEKPKRPKPKIGTAEVKSGIAALWPPLKKALGRTRRSVCIHPLNLHVMIAGFDPAETAKLYGWGQALLWSTMPELERLLVIPDPHIRLDPDFEGDRTRLEGEIGVSIRVGSVLRIALTLLLPALQWYQTLPKAAENAADAAKNEETGAALAAQETPSDKPSGPENTMRGE